MYANVSLEKQKTTCRFKGCYLKSLVASKNSSDVYIVKEHLFPEN